MASDNEHLPIDRPDPEALLRMALDHERAAGRGRLKIFLGYSAGVGKTYAMLESAQRLSRDGVDVVVAYVETHKRAETAALLRGLEILPRAALEHRGATFEEMDLDGVLRRAPKVALVDELAHTNVTGARHAKRYQDVQELLAAGIDVYTTLNIQHIESLNDVIAKVTGVAMRETVPDGVLDEADDIEVVDIPIGDLIKRLKEGRVYVPEAAERALAHFFSESNLTALRELTFRKAAKRVDTQMQKYLTGRSSGGPVPVGERLLVCVSHYPSSVELVRAGRLLAAGLDAEWIVVYVETPGKAALDPARQDQLTRTLRLAEELGARVMTLSGRNVADEVVDYASRHNVTKILIGKPLKRRLSDLVLGTIVDQLIRRSGGIDVYVINRSLKDAGVTPPPSDPRSRSSWWSYVLSMLYTGLATLLGLLTMRHFEPTNIVMFYLTAVVASAVGCGRGPSVFTAALSVIVFDYVFVPPRLTFAVSDVQYVFTFLTLFLVGLVISTLTVRLRERVESIRRRESYTSAMYSLSRGLAASARSEEVAACLIKNVRDALGASSVVLVSGEEGLRTAQRAPDFELDDHERAVADWVFRNGRPAGRYTETLPGAHGHHVPLKTAGGVYGTLGLAIKERDARLLPEQRQLLESFAGQAGAALERVLLAEEAHRTRLLEEREKLQSALLNSISHDLRTPLVSITGSLSGLMGNPAMDPEASRELLENAYEEAVRLNRLVGNLLDMARLEAQALRMTKSPCEVRDVIGSALEELKDRLGDRKVTVNLQEPLPLVPMDFSLMMKVLVNIIDNAVKYAPFGLPVDIDAAVKDDQLEIRVSDRGLGIPTEDLEHVFDKFYRVKRPQNFEGTGLGLSICKGILEAHRGTIRAEHRPGGGTVIRLRLPIGP